MSSLVTKPYSELQATDAVTGKFMWTDCADKDAFYRLRVSNLETLFEGSTVYDSNRVQFDDDLPDVFPIESSITGPVEAAMILSVSSGSLSNIYAARQTHFYAHYQPGKSFMAMFSFCFGAPATGIVKRAGFYDVDNTNNNNPLNGIVFEQTQTGGYQWSVYKGDGITVQNAPRASWNVDPLDGSGPSGVILSPTTNLLAFVDLEWLGVGRVRVGFYINGVPAICHTFNNAGLSTPYMNSPLLPIRYEIRKLIPNAASSMKAICCTILSEGGQEILGNIRTLCFPALTASVPFQLSGTQVKSILAVRLQSFCPRALLIPNSVEIVATIGGNAIAYYSVYLWRPSSSSLPTGAVAWTAVSNSFVEYTGTDLYTQMTGDSSGVITCMDFGSVVSKTKTSFQNVSRSVIYAQSNISKANRDILLIVIDNNNVGNNRQYNVLFTWREV